MRENILKLTIRWIIQRQRNQFHHKRNLKRVPTPGCTGQDRWWLFVPAAVPQCEIPRLLRSDAVFSLPGPCRKMSYWRDWSERRSHCDRSLSTRLPSCCNLEGREEEGWRDTLMYWVWIWQMRESHLLFLRKINPSKSFKSCERIYSSTLMSVLKRRKIP